MAPFSGTQFYTICQNLLTGVSIEGKEALEFTPQAMKASTDGLNKESLHSREENTIVFSDTEMLEFIRFIRKNSKTFPRTYWVEVPFYFAVDNHKKHFCLGYRPEDLDYIETINKRALRMHQAYLNRLDRFPLDKAEFYMRLQESHGVSSVRGLSKITGEDWSYIAKVFRLLGLPESIRDFLRNNKDNPDVVKFFTLHKLLDIVRQGDERLQTASFRELLDCSGVSAQYSLIEE